VFIGPRAETLEAVGDKKRAREAARAAGLPIAPGWEGEPLGADGKPTAAAIAAAKKLGFPLLLKAVSGGGGKGMRTIHDADGLAEGLAGTAREALASFGSAAVYMERRLEPVRHIEVQFLGDGKGGAWHLLERECSLQRRHQKVIEESPGARVDAALRGRLTDAAKAIVSAVKYRGAGTAEFRVDDAGAIHFLEINARIQVEHPVTEAITGIDLVAAQIAVAEGRPLRLRQQDIEFTGHAIECRTNAEDPEQGDRPTPGRVTQAWFPAGPGVRVDSHIEPGREVPPWYDSLLAKIIVHGADRAAAVAAMENALANTRIEGLTSNLALQRRFLGHDTFRTGVVDTGWLARLAEERRANA
jgi:acetyl-CoA carboxylase biotin carboxylase subunit